MRGIHLIAQQSASKIKIHNYIENEQGAGQNLRLPFCMRLSGEVPAIFYS